MQEPIQAPASNGTISAQHQIWREYCLQTI